MIPYHAGPITPNAIALRVWQGRHALVSFADRDQAVVAAELARTFALEPDAESMGDRNARRDYYDWVRAWRTHPAFEFALMPFDPQGSGDLNEYLQAEWPHGSVGVPVWCLGESIERLNHLSRAFPRVAIHAGVDEQPMRSRGWWDRLGGALSAICDDGRPRCRLHGHRLLNPAIHRHVPLSSADTDLVARAIHQPERWRGPLAPMTTATRAAVLAERLETYNAPGTWAGLRSGIDDWSLDWIALEDGEPETEAPEFPNDRPGPDTEARAGLDGTNESDHGDADQTAIRRLA